MRTHIGWVSPERVMASHLFCFSMEKGFHSTKMVMSGKLKKMDFWTLFFSGFDTFSHDVCVEEALRNNKAWESKDSSRIGSGRTDSTYRFLPYKLA